MPGRNAVTGKTMKVQAIAHQGIGGAAASVAAAERGGQPPSGGATPAADATGTPTAAAVQEAVGTINKAIQSLVSTLEFSVDDSTKMNVVKVVDTKTKEVLRQFPSQEVLDIAKALGKLQGVLLKERA
jgi:flagellar protein FlaG